MCRRSSRAPGARPPTARRARADLWRQRRCGRLSSFLLVGVLPHLRRRPAPLSQARTLASVRYQFVDCRWDLGNPARGRELYLAGHIPGAAFLDVDRDLSAPPGEGRHPLPSAEAFAAAAGRAGIDFGVFVVAYGTMGGAERLW